MEYYGIHYDSVIEHHGIKGQRWGVRRYQNPDPDFDYGDEDYANMKLPKLK